MYNILSYLRPIIGALFAIKQYFTEAYKFKVPKARTLVQYVPGLHDVLPEYTNVLLYLRPSIVCRFENDMTFYQGIRRLIIHKGFFYFLVGLYDVLSYPG